MHTHLSLFEGDRNAFHEAGAPYQLSKVGRSFIAGLLRHAAEITAVTNQWVNSYKRLSGGGEAPTYICWGHNNRSALVRVPDVQAAQGAVDPGRVPLAGLRLQPLPRLRGDARGRAQGHRGGLRAARGAEDDVWALTDGERRALGIEPLPPSLAEAIAVMERSELVAETLGEHVFDFFLRNKRSEWQDYRRQVTAFELRPLPPGPLTDPWRPYPAPSRVNVELGWLQRPNLRTLTGPPDRGVGDGLHDHRGGYARSRDRRRRWT